jgi:hypothetical protein
MRITIEVSEENECTRAPWWMIINPKQNMRTGSDGVHAIASMITGPFFSRGSAQSYLDSRRHNFGKGATVYCASGHANDDYCRQIGDAEKAKREAKQ